MTAHVLQMGAPDPELNTSPIFDEAEDFSLDLGMETGVCYFNDVAYLRGGSEPPHREERGIWVRKGELRPD